MLIRIRASMAGLAAGAALFVGFVGCSPGPSSGTSTGTSAVTDGPEKRDQVVRMTYSAQITGSAEADFSQTIPVRVLTLTSEDENFKGLSLLSVGPNEPIDLGGQMWFRIAFDLMRFEGNGKYQIKAGSPRDLLKEQPSPKAGEIPESPDQSNVLVQFWTMQPAAGVQPQVFDNALEPCPVEVSKEGFKGSIRCSKVTDHEGNMVSISMTWG